MTFPINVENLSDDMIISKINNLQLEICAAQTEHELKISRLQEERDIWMLELSERIEKDFMDTFDINGDELKVMKDIFNKFFKNSL